MVHQYKLSYEQSIATTRSRLEQVDFCDANGNCFAPTTFSWTDIANKDARGYFDIQPEYEALGEYVYNQNNYNFQPGNFDGDGKGDLIYFVDSEHVDIWFYREDGKFDFKGFYPKKIYPDYDVSDNNYRFLTGDFNGDGLTDLVHLRSAGKASLWTGIGDGEFTIQDIPIDPKIHYDLSTENYFFLTGDFDGNGLTDLVHLAGDCEYVMWFSNGDGTFLISSFHPAVGSDYDITTNLQNYRIGDFNADGKTDLIHFFDRDNLYIWTSHWSGGGHGAFEIQNEFMGGHLDNNGYDLGPDGEFRYKTGDFNGDGLTDLIHLVNENYVHVWISEGNGRFDRRLRYPGIDGTDIEGEDDYHYEVADLDGDSKTDLVFFKSNTEVKVWLSQGDGTFDIKPSLPPHGYGIASNDYKYIMADFNGDGRSDLIHFISEKGAHVWKALGTGADMLKSITNGNEVKTSINYKSLIDSSVYTPDKNATFPIQDLIGPLYIVSDISTSNGLGGENQTSYYYFGAKMHLQGRGFLGFRRVEYIDEQTGKKTTNNFHQNYPLTGTLQSSQSELSDGTIIEKTENLWSVSIVSGESINPYFPFLRSSTTQSFEIDGSLITETKIENEYKYYGGKPTRIFIDSGDGYTTSTVNQYVNYKGPWHLGRHHKVCGNKNFPRATHTNPCIPV